MTQSEIRQHIHTAGVLHIVWGVIHLTGGLLLVLVFAGIGAVFASIANTPFYHAAPWLGLIVIAVVGLMVLISLPEIMAGIGLIRLRPWSRPLAIVVSACDLFHFPLGTLLGAYTIWALCSPDAGPLFCAAGRPGWSVP